MCPGSCVWNNTPIIQFSSVLCTYGVRLFHCVSHVLIVKMRRGQRGNIFMSNGVGVTIKSNLK